MNAIEIRNNDLSGYVTKAIGNYELTPLILEAIAFLIKGFYEGLILIDPDGKIEFMDKYSEKFFDLKPGEAKNFHITDLMSDTELHTVARTGVPRIGQIQNVKGEKMIVSRLPIKKDGKILGAIGKVIFHKLEEIERLNCQIENLRQKIKYYKKGNKETNSSFYTFENLLGRTPEFLRAKEIAMRVAPTDATVLLEGESGVGKELFAHSIHNLSKRRNGPFIRLNCPSIPFELAESELFGYERGAFSGARVDGKPGKFELGEGGTVFLDEVGSLPLSVQAKLLRVLQEKEIEKLGGRTTIKLDFRLIAATNINLRKLIETGRFRLDLFYRLNTLPIRIPPLRERKEDILYYIDYFLKQLNKRLETKIDSISDDALKIMINYDWPGNVRELTNVLEQSILNVTNGNMIFPDNLPSNILEKSYQIFDDKFNLKSILDKIEKETIKKALSFTNGNKRQASKLMDIQRCVLYQKLKKHKIWKSNRELS